MRQLGITMAFSFMHLLCLSQQSGIVVQSFEYIWPKYLTSYTGQVNVLSDEDVQRAVEKTFKNAIEKRWNVELPELKLNLKPASQLRSTPKFNTKLKTKQPGTWYLFVQMFDDPTTFYYNDAGGVGTRWQVKCKMVDYKDSVVFERQLLAGINIENTPSTEVRLLKLLAHPRHILRTFDSVAHWLFGPENIVQKDVWLKPAFVYVEKHLPSGPISSLQYNATDSILCLITEPKFCLQTLPMSSTQIGTNKKIVGNTAKTLLTAFTGIGTGKDKTYKYEAVFSFTMDDTTVYHCNIPYVETITADRERETSRNNDGSKSYSITNSSYQLTERRIDSKFENVVIRGKDTLTRFTVSYIKRDNASSSYTKMWDGADSASIIPLKREWNNKNRQDDVVLKIKTATDSVSMMSSVENTVKEFSINQKPVLIIYGTDIPSTGILLHPLSKSDLVHFTILASLPYSYFNYGGN